MKYYRQNQCIAAATTQSSGARAPQGFDFVTPEYDRSIPASPKNAVDQIDLSLTTDIEKFTTFAPVPGHEAMLQQLITEVVTLTRTLAPLRRA